MSPLARPRFHRTLLQTPRERLPAEFRQKGLWFKRTGYPDFEPHAMTRIANSFAEFMAGLRPLNDDGT